MFASPVRPRTMTKEWQEATEEYLKVRFTAMIASIRLTILTFCRHKEVSPLLVTRE